ncbi:MAG: hypothetical protein ACXW3O_00540 [Brevundimonas sp.]
MTALATPRSDILPGPFGVAPTTVSPSPAVQALVGAQVAALLESSPAYHALDNAARGRLQEDLEKIAAYSAALVHEDWVQSTRLGQTPMVRERRVVEGLSGPGSPPPVPSPSAGRARSRTLSRTLNEDGEAPVRAIDEFDTRATGSIARITEETLNAIAFPTFVADLIKGTFQAIVDASIQQMEAYGELLANVAKTVDEFMADNISDGQGKDWLANAYPQVFRMEIGQDGARVTAREDAPDDAGQTLRRGLSLNEDPSLEDEDIEGMLIPAARRQLARSRQQLLATMVLMGMNRIVVTSGKIKARMDFRINAQDSGTAQSAQQFDFKHENQAKYGWFLSPVSVSQKTSVAYVSSSAKAAASDIEASAEVGGEVEIKFKSDYFPLERFADMQRVEQIQANTAVPAANAPVVGAAAAQAAAPASVA